MADGDLMLPDPSLFAGGADEDGKYKSALVRSLGGSGFQGSIAQIRPAISSIEKVERPYEENIWVRAGLKAVSQAFSRLPFELWEGEPNKEESKKLETHPILDLLRSPNPLQTQAEFWTAFAVDYKHDGEVYWFLANASGEPITVTGEPSMPNSLFFTEVPAQIIQVRGSNVKHKTNKNGVPIEYKFAIATTESTGTGDDGNWSEPWPAGAVIPFIDYDPYNMVRGLGDVQAVMREIDQYLQAQRYTDGSLRNSGDPGAWVVFKKKLAPAEIVRREAELNDDQNPAQSDRYKVLDADAQIIPGKGSAKDMEYMNLLDWLRDSILAALGVPPPMVGVYKDATYNNIETAERLMWTGPNGIMSLVARVQDTVTNKLLARFKGGRNGKRTLWAHFNTEDVEVLKDSITPQIELAKDLTAAGVGLSMSDALELQGVDVPDLEPQEGEDERTYPAFVATNLRPADQVLDQGDEANAVQEAALNGAQIAQLTSIVEKVGQGTIPKETAVELIVASFPVDRERAQKILEPVEEGSAAPPPETVPPVPGEGSEAAQEGEAGEENQDDEDTGSPSLVDGGMGFALHPWDFTDAPATRRRGYQPGKPIEPDAALAQAVEQWLSEFEAAQLELWQDIASGNRATAAVMVRADLTDAELDILVLNQAEWGEHFSALTDQPLEDIFGDALQVANETWGGPFLTTSDPRVLQALVSQQITLQSVSVTTTNKVRELLLREFANLDDGLRLPLEQRIADMLPDLTEELRRTFGTKEARANAISRTETGRAQNGAAYLQMRESGVTKVRWFTNVDGNERASHRSVHDTVVDIGTRFANGLLHPHDPGAPAGEVVNCRCWFEPAAFEGDDE